jgi:hypothetical protein
MPGRQPEKGRVAAAAVILQLREAAFAAAGVAGALGAVEAAIGDCQTAPFLSHGKESCWLPKGVYHPLLCHAHKAMCAAFSDLLCPGWMLCERHGSGTTPRRNRRCLMRRARLRPRQLPRRRQPTLKQPAGISLKASMRLAEGGARLAAKATGVILHTRNADPTCLSVLPYRLVAKAILHVSNSGCQLEPVLYTAG